MAASALNLNSLGVMNSSNRFESKSATASATSRPRAGQGGRPVLPVPDSSTYRQLMAGGGLYGSSSPNPSPSQGAVFQGQAFVFPPSSSSSPTSPASTSTSSSSSSSSSLAPRPSSSSSSSMRIRSRSPSPRHPDLLGVNVGQRVRRLSSPGSGAGTRVAGEQATAARWGARRGNGERGSGGGRRSCCRSTGSCRTWRWVRGKVGMFEAQISGIRDQVLTIELQRSPRSPRRQVAGTSGNKSPAPFRPIGADLSPKDGKSPSLSVLQNGRATQEEDEELRDIERRKGLRGEAEGSNPAVGGGRSEASASGLEGGLQTSPQTAETNRRTDGGRTEDGRGREEDRWGEVREQYVDRESGERETRPGGGMRTDPEQEGGEGDRVMSPAERGLSLEVADLTGEGSSQSRPPPSGDTSKPSCSSPPAIPSVVVTDHGLESGAPPTLPSEGLYSDQGLSCSPSPGSSPVPGLGSSPRSIRKLSSSSMSSTGFSSSWEESEEDVSSRSVGMWSGWLSWLWSLALPTGATLLVLGHRRLPRQ
ncbi:hypothetical protein CRUP_035102 [Coryphaenoides rupestris]|nr:hypothetical protein CRUP_035102 [Coryphaenoides rupestris]